MNLFHLQAPYKLLRSSEILRKRDAVRRLHAKYVCTCVRVYVWETGGCND